HRVDDFPLLNQPDSIAGQAGQLHRLWIDRPNVEEMGDEQPAVGAGDQLLDRRVSPAHHDAAREGKGLRLRLRRPGPIDAERLHPPVSDPAHLSDRLAACAGPAAKAESEPKAAASSTPAACRRPRSAGYPRIERVGANRHQWREYLLTQAVPATRLGHEAAP